ncbi:MAG: hypothetical protein ACI89X_000066 [Planctomycetota bacterium]|jgi:hypothetical protein
MTTRQRVAQGYLLLQAMAVAGWWLWLCTSTAARERFTVADWPEESLLAFAVPDSVLLVFGSAIASRGVVLGRSWAPLAMWLVTGAAAFAALYCIAASAITDSTWLGSTMMLLCTAGSGSMALLHSKTSKCKAAATGKVSE